MIVAIFNCRNIIIGVNCKFGPIILLLFPILCPKCNVSDINSVRSHAINYHLQYYWNAILNIVSNTSIKICMSRWKLPMFWPITSWKVILDPSSSKKLGNFGPFQYIFQRGHFRHILLKKWGHFRHPKISVWRAHIFEKNK